MLITSVQVLLRQPQQRPPVGLSFWTIAMLYMAVSSESAGVEYLCQIVNLHPLQEISAADLVLGGDSAHPMDYCCHCQGSHSSGQIIEI